MTGIRVKHEAPEDDSRLGIASEFASLSNFVFSCYGPIGKAKIFASASEGGCVILTSSSSRVFRYLQWRHPIPQVAISLLKPQARSWGDCGLFSCGLATRLLSGVLRLDRASGPMLSEALTMALSAVSSALNQPNSSFRVEFKASQLPAYLSLLRGLLWPKRVTTRLTWHETDYLSTLLLECFLKTLGTVDPLESVRMLPVLGAEALDSSVHNGVMIDVPFTTFPTDRNEICDVRVIACKAKLELEDLITEKIQYNIHNGSFESHSMKIRILERVAEHVCKLNVSLVVCQKTVARELVHLLVQRGILVWQRLSIRHFDSFCRVSRAKLLQGLLPVPDASDVGHVSSITRRKVGVRSMWFVSPSSIARAQASPRPSSKPVSVREENTMTMVFGAADENAADEIEGLLRDGLLILSRASRAAQRLLCPVGGVVEIALAQKLKSVSSRSRGKQGKSSSECRLIDDVFNECARALEASAAALVGLTSESSLNVLTFSEDLAEACSNLRVDSEKNNTPCQQHDARGITARASSCQALRTCHSVNVSSVGGSLNDVDSQLDLKSRGRGPAWSLSQPQTQPALQPQPLPQTLSCPRDCVHIGWDGRLGGMGVVMRYRVEQDSSDDSDSDSDSDSD
eukprot:Rmarinus@m.15900